MEYGSAGMEYGSARVKYGSAEMENGSGFRDQGWTGVVHTMDTCVGRTGQQNTYIPVVGTVLAGWAFTAIAATYLEVPLHFSFCDWLLCTATAAGHVRLTFAYSYDVLHHQYIDIGNMA